MSKAWTAEWDAGQEVPQDHLPKEKTPRIQWFHGKGKSFEKLSPLLAYGGFEFPVDAWENEHAIPGEILDIPHGDDTDAGVIFPSLQLSIIAQHFIWERREGTSIVEYSRQKGYPGPGFSGRSNSLVFVKQLLDLGYTKPVRLTLGGKFASGGMWTIMKQFKEEILSAAASVGKARAYPVYMFFVPIIAGPVQKTAKEYSSVVTPPVKGWEINEGNKGKVTTDLWIGSELQKDIINRWYDYGQQWLKDESFLSDFDSEDAQPIGHSNGQPAPAPELDPADEIPF